MNEHARAVVARLYRHGPIDAKAAQKELHVPKTMLQFLTRSGLLERDGNIYQLTERGRLLARKDN